MRFSLVALGVVFGTALALLAVEGPGPVVDAADVKSTPAGDPDGAVPRRVSSMAATPVASLDQSEPEKLLSILYPAPGQKVPPVFNGCVQDDVNSFPVASVLDANDDNYLCPGTCPGPYMASSPYGWQFSFNLNECNNGMLPTSPIFFVQSVLTGDSTQTSIQISPKAPTVQCADLGIKAKSKEYIRATPGKNLKIVKVSPRNQVITPGGKLVVEGTHAAKKDAIFGLLLPLFHEKDIKQYVGKGKAADGKWTVTFDNTKDLEPGAYILRVRSNKELSAFDHIVIKVVKK